MYDVAVIGGGLAGCSAAITLAESGHSVALLEAKDYPRHRVCGEFLSPECVQTLDALGAMPVIRAQRPTWMTYTRITTPAGVTWERDLPGTAMGISRYVLDALLAERAADVGADVRTQATVTDVRGGLADGFTLTVRGGEPIRARVVVSAHGKRATLDRTLERGFLRQRQPFVGMKMHYDAPPVPARVELHAFEGGYCGLSEVEGGAVNACLLVREDVFKAAGGVTAFVEWMGAQNPALGAWLDAATPRLDRWRVISQVPFVDKTAVEREMLMVGDAAGLITPLAGNGMGMALDGGRTVAAHVDDYLHGETTAEQLLRGYTSAWRRQFGRRMQVGRFAQTWLLRPSLLTLGLRALKAVPPLGDFFIRQTRDVNTL